MLFLWISHATK